MDENAQAIALVTAGVLGFMALMVWGGNPKPLVSPVDPSWKPPPPPRKRTPSPGSTPHYTPDPSPGSTPNYTPDTSPDTSPDPSRSPSPDPPVNWELVDAIRERSARERSALMVYQPDEDDPTETDHLLPDRPLPTAGSGWTPTREVFPTWPDNWPDSLPVVHPKTGDPTRSVGR